MEITNIIKTSPLTIAIILYVLIILSIVYFKPDYIYKKDENNIIKNNIWIVFIVIALLTYSVICCCSSVLSRNELCIKYTKI